jgi:heme/copper-type cytochrome/quinol oxidase subunit 2
MSPLSILAAEALHPLFLPAWVFGLIAVLIFVILGFMTFSYRDVANRHANKTDKSGAGHH